MQMFFSAIQCGGAFGFSLLFYHTPTTSWYRYYRNKGVEADDPARVIDLALRKDGDTSKIHLSMALQFHAQFDKNLITINAH